ncbi:MAG: sporulation protein YqfD, partial [Clostridia bacterium]|nr:sporulation protein YqfD [Clostridia bacterium]
ILKNIRRLGENRIIADISIISFKQIRQVCYRTRTSVKIIKRHGFPFLLHRYRKRKYLLIGVVIATVILWYTSGHIMGITVVGNKRIDTDTILNHLARSDIALGKSAKNIDSEVIRNQMIRDLDELVWVGINVNGSRVYVEIVERIEKKQGVDKNAPCHLVASKDGVISSIEARDGQTMVKPGAGVRAGDVLVSGIMDNLAVGYRYVHAYGEVYAKTRYKKTEEYPLEYDEKVRTGEKKTRYTVKVLDKNIPLFLREKPPYECFEKEEKEKEYCLPADIIPSIFLWKETYYECENVHQSKNSKEVFEEAKAQLYEELCLEIPEGAEIVDKEINQSLTERGTLQVEMTLICKENIAEEFPIEKGGAIDRDISS